MQECVHCQKLKPQFETLVKQQPLKGIKFVMINEYDEKYKLYSEGISCFPTIVVDDTKTIYKYVGYTKCKQVIDRFID